MKYLVTGGRDYPYRGNVYRVLSHLLEDSDFLIVGDATGADQYAREWAKSYDHPHRVVKAPWWALGKRAGPLRNSYMLNLRPDVVIAFPGGPGTKNCVDQALMRNIPVFKYQTGVAVYNKHGEKMEG